MIKIKYILSVTILLIGFNTELSAVTLQERLKECDNGEAASCWQAGHMYEIGRGVEQNYTEAKLLYEKAKGLGSRRASSSLSEINNLIDEYNNAKICNSGKTCFYLGDKYENGKSGMKKDLKKAAKFYEKSCDYGYGQGCGYLGWLFKKDMLYKESAHYYRLACDQGYAKGCNNLSVLYVEHTDMVEKDFYGLMDLYSKSCNGFDGNGCYNLGYYIERRQWQGEDIRQRYLDVLRLYTRSCYFGSEMGCVNKKDFAKYFLKKYPIYFQKKRWDQSSYHDKVRVDSIVGVVWENRFYDRSSGLLWQDDRAAKINSQTWGGARSYCQNLVTLGYDNWYLPTDEQLMGLYKKKDELKNVALDVYWSSSQPDGFSKSAISVSFKNNTNRKHSGPISAGAYVRCVHD